MSNNFNFFKAALKNYKTSGTLVPSSKFLANRMLAQVDLSKAKVIVELGPGNGAITKKILEKITPSTTLICFEINTVFLKELEKNTAQSANSEKCFS
ncbi:rRNA adenine N-6-methyltransferase family protein [Tenacibaculum sp. SG-28]|uniref:rRNA adenine N-6-methyltransferase family protein n=1 Tax=Tenacibaculum sp. SG-28 TaxID=754426 RepID=UPI001E53E4A2|nr:rRNA adenine N-6-methyltransferase family protein [Tenacibaculum sp. SG-28]